MLNTNIREEAYHLFAQLSEDKIKSAFDYIKYLYDQEAPLDDFDYFLAKQADERGTEETVSFDEALKECGLSHGDLSD